MLDSGFLRFTSRDRSDPVAKAFLFRVSLLQAAPNLDQFTAIEDGRLLILENACVIAVPGAAQTITGMSLTLTDRSGNVVQILVDRREGFPAAGLGASFDRQWSGLVIPSSYRIDATGAFSAGAAANFLSLSIAGYTIPRGNFQP